MKKLVFIVSLCVSLHVETVPFFSANNPPLSTQPSPVQYRENKEQIEFFAEALWWIMDESCSEWGETFGLQDVVVGPVVALDVHTIDFKWNGGLRLGGSYAIPYDQWNTAIYYTWFATQNTQAKTAPTLAAEFSAFPSALYISAFDYTDLLAGARLGSTKWRILFNMFDWILTRPFFYENDWTISPRMGLKGGWIHQKIDMNWLYAQAITGTEKIKNNFWGIGPSGGMDMSWDLAKIRSHRFTLFGSCGGALMWGRWTFGDIYQTSSNATSIVHLSAKNSAALELEGLLGIGWNTTFRKDSVDLGIQISYEMQFWLNQLQTFTVFQGRLFSDLTVQGAVFNVNTGF